MSQPRLVVDRSVVESLVSGFGTRRACTNYRPAELDAALRALPGDPVGYHDAVRVVLRFQCTKMVPGCNRWTFWMMHQLNERKRAVRYEPQG